MDVYLFRELKLISLNNQLINLYIVPYQRQFNNKDEIKLANKERLACKWNNQPKSFRVSSFTTNHLIMKMALNKEKPRAFEVVLSWKHSF